jgi:hypothetical protein
MLIAGIIERYCRIWSFKSTDKGRAFEKKENSFKIVLNNLFEDANTDDDFDTSEDADAVSTSVEEDIWQTQRT